jgi:hypothetical protein
VGAGFAPPFFSSLPVPLPLKVNKKKDLRFSNWLINLSVSLSMLIKTTFNPIREFTLKIAISIFTALLMLGFVLSCTQKDYTTNNTYFSQPELSITLPVPGDTLRGLVAISVQTSGNAEISHVEFYLDGVLPDSAAYDSSAPYQYMWNTANAIDGNHLVLARAWTPGGNYGDAVPLLVLTDNINENAPRNLRVPSQYPSIQQGVNAAKDGDTVLVEPGTYHEDFNFQGKPIWVKSEFGPAQTVWEGTNQNIFIYFNQGEDTNSVLCGFKIMNSYNGIYIDLNSSPTITNCIIKDMEYTGIISSITNAKIINNTIYNCYGTNGSGMQIAGISLVMNNNVVHGSDYGLWNASGSPQYRPIGDYNNIFDWGEGNYGNNWIVGMHDIHSDPEFIDSIDFHLQVGSPCRDSGDPNIFDPDGTRSDIGAWGGPHAY